ncbi:ATP-binding protein [Methanobrevibacter filiformis]|uniref:Magnesium-chelatase 38 kDa subunit n=1 Tax=Methanobrevibacter filiformis TaxID=55758 RepID=A0A166DLT2_9EURY|nr:ATP-binding protein [Methanobrevibacter filiformis]KZX15733.1 magnesium-chelatase 38 kDa subunit [Methanobrevibacter filiformis]
MKKAIFPFTAIVCQEDIKKALILNVINPSIGGVLIQGSRGTGKTTAVRSIANLLPEIEMVENSPFNCEYKDNCTICSLCQNQVNIIKTPIKIVELPLGATEDRVVGSLNIENALNKGVKSLEPGILASANRNILYIDEINLLDDNLVDILLDSAAMGTNIVEREGISVSHPSRFILVGTMNPEEGELRKQLSDRIGLKISSEDIIDIHDRILIVKRKEEFEKNPSIFINKYKTKEIAIKNKIANAKNLIHEITISDYLIEIIGGISLNLGVEGHRSDITILKTAKTIAAFNNHKDVNENDLEEAIKLVLGNVNQNCNTPENIKNQINKAKQELGQENKDTGENSNSNNMDIDNSNNKDNNNGDNSNNGDIDNNEYTNSGTENNENYDENEFNNELKDENSNNDSSQENNDLSNNLNRENNSNTNNSNNSNTNVDFAENKYERKLNSFLKRNDEVDINKLMKIKGREKKKAYGNRVNSITEKGKYVKSKNSKGNPTDIAIDATIRSAILHSKNGNIKVKKEDLKEKIRKHKSNGLIALVIDLSGSMVSEEKVNKIKSIINLIIKNVNKHKDKLVVIGFKGKDSEIIIPNTKRPLSFSHKLDEITVGGTTPTASGLYKGLEILKREMVNKEYVPILMLLSDGMPNVGLKNHPVRDVLDIGHEIKKNNIYTIIIDFDKKHKHGRNINMELAITTNGRYYDLEGISNQEIAINKILDYERENI